MSSSKTASIEYGLETPYPLQPSQNYVRLEGWALIRGGSQPTTTRLRIGDACFAPESRPVRTDVAEMFKDDPNAADSGFIFVCYLPFGNHLGFLEASADEGETWQVVKSLVMPVSSHPLMGRFEPAGEFGRVSEEVRLAGWCWHPEQKIRKATVLMGDIEVPTEFGLSRPDVATRFPQQPESAHAGFMTRENLPRGRGPIRLQVETLCGRTYFLDSELQADIEVGAFLPTRQVGNMWRLPPSESLPEVPMPDQPTDAGASNILFVLFGDFTSNSANHVTALANEMIALGYDCVVAVPDHPETIEAQPSSRFLPITFAELSHLPSYFRDHHGPAVTHVWTPREGVREVWLEIQKRYSSDLVIHLEDNERELLRDHLGLSEEAFGGLTPVDFDRLVPGSLSHPERSSKFMKSAQGVTTIIESLKKHSPAEVPTATFWPAATDAFTERELNLPLRHKLSIPDSDTVIFYHGNVHAANMAEMLSLYHAVVELNATGHSTWLLRTGRDCAAFETATAGLLPTRLIEIGFVKRAKDLPALMSAADIFVQPGAPGEFNDYRFPSKLPEFFAIGRPVILPAANLGGTVEHRKHAYVLDIADAKGIAAAVVEIMNNRNLRDRLSLGAVEFAEEYFSWNRSAAILRDFYLKHTRLNVPSDRDTRAVALLNSVYAKNVGLT